MTWITVRAIANHCLTVDVDTLERCETAPVPALINLSKVSAIGRGARAYASAENYAEALDDHVYVIVDGTYYHLTSSDNPTFEELCALVGKMTTESRDACSS